MKIKTYNDIANIEVNEKRKILNFIESYIAEGTVIMPSSVYESASSWTILKNNHGVITGFSAQKVFINKPYNTVQIMATFLDKSVRGKKFAAILLQGFLMLKLWINNPLKSIFWCTRTRIAGVYKAASRYNNIYPKLEDVQNNNKKYMLASQLATQIYGKHIILDKDTYVMRNSYIEDGIFLYPSTSNQHSNELPNNYFNRVLDYTENEAIFIFSKLKIKTLLQFFLIYCLFISKSYIENKTTVNELCRDPIKIKQ